TDGKVTCRGESATSVENLLKDLVDNDNTANDPEWQDRWQGVKTYVMAFAAADNPDSTNPDDYLPTIDQGNLNRIPVAGGTALTAAEQVPLTKCHNQSEPCYFYFATTGPEFLQAILAIGGKIRSCSVSFNANNVPDPAFFRVYLGVELLSEAAGDYSFSWV